MEYIQANVSIQKLQYFHEAINGKLRHMAGKDTRAMGRFVVVRAIFPLREVLVIRHIFSVGGRSLALRAWLYVRQLKSPPQNVLSGYINLSLNDHFRYLSCSGFQSAPPVHSLSFFVAGLVARD